MGNYHAVAAVSQAIVDLLEKANRPAEFATARFSLFRTEDFELPLESVLAVYLYRIVTDRSGRHMPLAKQAGIARVSQLRVNLHYLITPGGADAQFEPQLLAWAMRVLEDTPVLPGELLNLTTPGTFAANEAVQLTLEDLSPMEAAGIWQALRCPYRLGVSYVARGVMIDSLK